MTRGAALTASLAAVLDRPRWWAPALAVFLVRGGVLAALLPIVVLPTVAGLHNALGPLLVGVYFGVPSETFIWLVQVGSAALLAWLLAGGLAASWLELALIDEAAIGAGSRIVARPAALAWRALLIRLLSMAPLAVAVGWGAVRVWDAAYVEVLRPADVTVPIVLRVIARIPEVIGLLFATWLAGETAGGLAVRRLALGTGGSTLAALARGWADLVTRPWSLVVLVVTSLVVLGVIAVTGMTAAYSWLGLRAAMDADWGSGLAVLVQGVALLAFVTTWLAGLALIAVAVSWRSAAWTFETVRRTDLRRGLHHAGVGAPVEGGRPVSAAR